MERLPAAWGSVSGGPRGCLPRRKGEASQPPAGRKPARRKPHCRPRSPRRANSNRRASAGTAPQTVLAALRRAETRDVPSRVPPIVWEGYFRLLRTAPVQAREEIGALFLWRCPIIVAGALIGP